MKKVELLILLDVSGSMTDTISEAVQAANELLKEQVKIPGKVKVTVKTFASSVGELVNRQTLTEGTVIPVPITFGMTALYDAVGHMLTTNAKKKVVFFILTDGEENCSRHFSLSEIEKLIEAKKEIGWDISFIGAGIDAHKASKGMGISRSKTVSVDKTKGGMESLRLYTSVTTTEYRTKS